MRFLALTLFGIYRLASSSTFVEHSQGSWLETKPGSRRTIDDVRVMAPTSPGGSPKSSGGEKRIDLSDHPDYMSFTKYGSGGVAGSRRTSSETSSGGSHESSGGETSIDFSDNPDYTSYTKSRNGGVAGSRRTVGDVRGMAPKYPGGNPKRSGGKTRSHERFTKAAALQEKRLELKGAMETLGVPEAYIISCIVAMTQNSAEADHLMGMRPYAGIKVDKPLDEIVAELKRTFSSGNSEYARCFEVLDEAVSIDKIMSVSREAGLREKTRLDAFHKAEAASTSIETGPRQYRLRMAAKKEEADRIVRIKRMRANNLQSILWVHEGRDQVIPLMMLQYDVIIKRIIIKNWGLTELEADRLMELAARD